MLRLIDVKYPRNERRELGKHSRNGQLFVFIGTEVQSSKHTTAPAINASSQPNAFAKRALLYIRNPLTVNAKIWTAVKTPNCNARDLSSGERASAVVASPDGIGICVRSRWVVSDQ